MCATQSYLDFLDLQKCTRDHSKILRRVQDLTVYNFLNTGKI